MAITLEMVEAIRKKLQDAPEVSPAKRQVTKQEAIANLRGEIEAMQKRGYTLDDINKMIRENGIDLSVPSLKSYLQRSKAKPKSTPKKASA